MMHNDASRTPSKREPSSREPSTRAEEEWSELLQALEKMPLQEELDQSNNSPEKIDRISDDPPPPSIDHHVFSASIDNEHAAIGAHDSRPLKLGAQMMRLGLLLAGGALSLNVLHFVVGSPGKAPPQLTPLEHMQLNGSVVRNTEK